MFLTKIWAVHFGGRGLTKRDMGVKMYFWGRPLWMLPNVFILNAAIQVRSIPYDETVGEV